MKLLIRDYIASLKEREELDAILPDLLSELGFNVYSRPGRGTAQRGVDIAAVGRDEDGHRKVFLFSVKQGDLTRREWDNNTPQALRPSLNEILDDYIPNRIPPRYKGLKVVICLCFGGDVKETAHPLVNAYIKKHTSRRISFDQWNGDKIAELLLRGVLREELLPKPLRSNFQKAVAMVDQPDVSLEHFSRLVSSLRQSATLKRDSIRAARQMYICLWVLFVWARDADNLDAPYRASELVLLNLWNLVRPLIGKKTAHAKAVVTVVQHVIALHRIIAKDFLTKKILPHVARRHALSTAVHSRASVDVNLRLFDILGRIALFGHWTAWASKLSNGTIDEAGQSAIDSLVMSGMQCINNNPALFLPLRDDQAIEVALFLMLAAQTKDAHRDIHIWLSQMAQRLDFTVRTHGRYPCSFTDYEDLFDHPKERTDEYRRDATAGSTLIPLLAAWLSALGDEEALANIVDLKASDLAHCTFQLWVPEPISENHLYLDDDAHGLAICDLPITQDGEDLLRTIKEACTRSKGFEELSADKSGYWPVILTACRHHRLPVPPHFWIGMLMPSNGPAT